MKRLLTTAAMFLCSLLTFAQFSGSGSGTENDPYLILNPIQLNQMRNFLNQSGVYFKLMADIDLAEFIEEEYGSTQGWMPVGTKSTPFQGVFNGNGHSIKNLWVNRLNVDYVGLFGYIEGGTIKNVTIVGNTLGGKNYVGLVAGYCSYSNILDCNFSGNVKGQSYVGGCIGKSDVINMNNVSSSANVEGKDYTGGLIGECIGTFDNPAKVSLCRINYNIIKGDNYVGGICGYFSSLTSNNASGCFVYSSISGNNNVGGILGNGIVYDSGFVGDIYANSVAGGIVGSGKVYTCFAIGHIKASGESVGGIMGSGSWVTSSYFTGTVSGDNAVGGLVGFCDNLSGEFSGCYSRSTVTGRLNVGGLFGNVNGFRQTYSGRLYIKSNVANITHVKATEGNIGRIFGRTGDCVGLGEIGTPQENKALNRAVVIEAGVVKDVTDDLRNGTGVSATTLKLKATYVAMGWDFNGIWTIQETECYPYFKSQTAPPVITSQVVSGATTISGKCVDGGTITLEIDGVKQQQVSTGNSFSFNVSPLQAGHEVRICAKAEGKEQSYFTTEIVSYIGKGTESDPYQVYTAADLTGVYRKGYFKLMNDIDLTSYISQFSPSEGWQSIGRDGSETIHFDGDGHKITGLWCNSTRDNTGLFSCFANGTIKNLTVETAKGKQVKGGANTGILIGKMINGTIENCRVSGNVADGTPVGGMVGLFDGGKISLSQANVTINTTGEKSYVGGLVGEITGGEIDQCVTLGNLSATGKESYVGGLVGKNFSTITNCYSNANVTSSYNSAGLVAYNYGLVDKCYATGNLSSSNYGAGVIGYNDGTNAVVKNCVAMNNKIDVTFESQSSQSGGYGLRIIGGLQNGAPAPELNNYALKTMQVSLNDVPQKVYDDIMNGVGKNGSDLAKGSTYQELGWDFSTIWAITEGESYPSLKNNAANVLNPGEDPGPGEDPEPVLSTDDQIVVNEMSASKGKTATLAIGLENKTTTLSAYQFDLTLPTGFTLSKNDKGKFQVSKTNRYEDESQTLNVSAVEGSNNTYRFVCFSMSNSVIEGTSGAILNAIIDVANDVEPGTYEGQITNIVFTKADGTQLKLNTAKFNIIVTNVTKGDANDDGEINVADIVEIVNYILGKPSAKFVEEAADLNGDGEINVTDIVKVVSIIMSANNTPRRSSLIESTEHDRLTLAEDEYQSLSLCLDNENGYVATQFDVHLSAGQTLDGISLNNNRSKDHILTYTKTNDNTYRVIVYSLGNQDFIGNSGELLNIQVSRTGGVDINNILFVTSEQHEKQFTPLHSYITTSIKAVEKVENLDIYSIDGRMVGKQVNKTNGLNKGIYIVNGKKHIIK